ncbi:MAG: efflux RND transporter periplasmic adaptor subunit [Marinoscillum sp.]
MNKTVKRILYIVVTLVILGIIVYPKLPTSEETTTTSISASKEKLLVDGIIIAKSPLRNQVNVTGSILADESVTLNSEVAGKVERISFLEGQAVKKGELLIKLNDDEVLAEIEKLQYTRKLNEDNEFRQKQLLDKEAISREEYETSFTTLNTTNAEIKIMQARLAKHHIKAPFGGVVGLRNISEGSYLNPGDRIAELYKVDPIKLEFSIPSKYISLVNTGDSILFTVDAYQEEFAGSIYAIEPQIDPQTRSLKVRAKAPNRSNQLLPGQFARIELILETIPNAMMVPTIAVIPELNGKKLYLYKNGKVETQLVETGIRTEDNLQITSGIAPGDTVIVSGLLQINQGSEVNINLK